MDVGGNGRSAPGHGAGGALLIQLFFQGVGALIKAVIGALKGAPRVLRRRYQLIGAPLHQLVGLVGQSVAAGRARDARDQRVVAEPRPCSIEGLDARRDRCPKVGRDGLGRVDLPAGADGLESEAMRPRQP